MSRTVEASVAERSGRRIQPARNYPHAPWWLLAPAALVLLGAGALIVLEHFDGLYGQDPFAYYDYATGPLREHLLRLQPPPPFFWPPGYPLLVALMSLAVGVAPLAGQLVSLLAGATVPVFTALLARELSSKSSDAGDDVLVPVLAALIVACTGQLWLWSTTVMADTTALALATAGVWATARYGNRGAARWLLLGAALLAFATITRWIYGIVALPVALYALIMIVQLQPRTRALLHAAGAALCAFVIVAPVLLPAIPQLLAGSAETVAFAGNFQVHEWHPARALQREFVTADGVLRFRFPSGLFYLIAPASWSFFTPLLAPLLLPGTWAVLRGRALAPIALLLGWAGVVYVFHAGAAYQALRLTLAYLPPLAILLAIGAAALARWLSARTGPAPLSRRVLGISFSAALIVMMIGGVRATRDLTHIKQQHLAAVRWTEAQLTADAELITFNLTATFRHYSRIATHELWSLTTEELDTLTSAGAPVFVLVDLGSIERQWRERSPGKNLRWLESNAGLTRLGEHSGFTLFRAGRPPAAR